MNRTHLYLAIFFVVAFLSFFFYKNDWKNKHRKVRLAYFRENPIGQKAIVFLGDSQIEFFDYKKLLHTLEDEKIFNRGVSGETLNKLRDRLDEVINANPKKIFIQIGINDLFNGDSSEKVYKNYQIILRKLKKNNPIVITLYPLGENKTITNSLIKDLNFRLKELCDKEKYGFINIYDSLINSKGFLNSKYSEDGLHLNIKGNELLVNLVKRNLE